MAKAVRITGHKEVRRQLRRIEDDMDQKAARGELKTMNLGAAQIVSKQAKSLVPVQTGTLRDTIRPAGAQKSGRVRAGFKRVPYAGAIHFGWSARGIEPSLFLYDALDDRRREVLRHYDEELEALIRKYDLD